MRATCRELLLLTNLEQHLSLKISSCERKEYSAVLASVVMDKEYHLQYYNLLRYLYASRCSVMRSYLLCLKQLEKAEISLYHFFSKQMLLFDLFRRVDASIYQKYTSRFSSLLWNLCVSLIAKKESSPTVHSIAASSLLMALSASQSDHPIKSCELDSILDRLFSVSTSPLPPIAGVSPLSRVFQAVHSTFPRSLGALPPAREFRFLFCWSLVEPSAAAWRAKVAQITRSASSVRPER